MPNGPKNIALCLSGGGFRATFFHLGTIKALQRSNLLGRVSHIFSVSGGSIVAAHLVLNWSKYCGDSNAFAKVVRHLYRFGKRDVRGRVVRRWILTCNLPRKLSKYGLGPTDHLEREYRGLFSNKSFADIESGAPKLYVLATNLITGQLTSFSKDGYAIEDQVNTLLDSNYIPLSLAVTASSAFPPMFPPVRVTPESLKVPHESFTAPILPSPHLLTDGGVYDNLGFEKAALMMQRGELPADLMILVSDAGGPLLTNIRDEFSWPISRGVRTADLLMNLVAENTLSKAKQFGMIKDRFLHCSIEATTTGGRLKRQLQKWLQYVRTDLDSFNDVEIDSLVDHGEQVALEKLPDAYGAFPVSAGDGLPSVFGEQELHVLEEAGTRKWRLFDWKDWATYILLGLALVVLSVPIYLLISWYLARGALVGIEQVVKAGGTAGVQTITEIQQLLDQWRKQ